MLKRVGLFITAFLVISAIQFICEYIGVGDSWVFGALVWLTYRDYVREVVND